MIRISAILSLFVFLATFTLAMEGEQKSPGIYLTMESEAWIKGEPIYIQVEKMGVRWDGGYYLDGEPCKQYGVPTVRHAPLVNPDGSPATSEGPPEEYFLQDETLALDITHLCSWRMKDMKAGSHELCYKRDKGDLCVTFRIDEPQGVDAEAWKKISKDYPNVLDAVQAKKHITRDDILSRFPTSTYAGWVLANTYSGASFSYNSAEDLVSELALTEEQRKEKSARMYGVDQVNEATWQSPQKKAIWYIEKTMAFLSAHPDFSQASILYARLALSYMILHRWQEADESLERTLALGFPANWLKTDMLLREVKKEIEKRGLTKSKSKR